MAGRHWTDAELTKLEEMSGTYTVATIAKSLGRSFSSVNQKINRLGISGFEKSTDLLTMNTVHNILGVDSRTLKGKWASKGLRIIRKGNYLCIRQEDLLKYLKNHPEDWNAQKVLDDSLLMGYSWYKEKKISDIRRNYNWTAAEVNRMKMLRKKGYYIREIAEEMGRSESSIKYKLYRKEGN